MVVICQRVELCIRAATLLPCYPVSVSFCFDPHEKDGDDDFSLYDSDGGD